MISISTAWNALTSPDGTMLVNEIKSLGVDTIELGFTLSQNKLAEILEARSKKLIKISSVHNFCPVPPGYQAGTFLPDSFSLASLFDEQRKQAVELTLNSLKVTKAAGAPVLVIHAGRVEMEQKTRLLGSLLSQGKKETPEYAEIVTALKLEREQKKTGHLRAIIKSLETLIESARKLDLKIGLENRYYYREIPSLDDFELIFDHFSSESALGYWHDLGHAQVSENLGLAKHMDYLTNFGDRLCGIHLHDVINGIDHQAPGVGNLDFDIIKPYLNDNIIKVIEVHHQTTALEIVDGISFLKAKKVF